jgi:Skp family chaperone for outer membrane proteins
MTNAYTKFSTECADLQKRLQEDAVNRARQEARIRAEETKIEAVMPYKTKVEHLQKQVHTSYVPQSRPATT